jgi:hypothetical protein
MARLLHGRQRTGAQPRLTQRVFELSLLAILFHDTGYLKGRDDTQGTGAKYTITHVERSAQFAALVLAENGFSDSEIKSVQNMIRCTGVNARLNLIPFQSEIEKIAGFALATSDLLGQMAAEDYVDKLPFLYAEFAEAAAFSEDQNHLVASFSSASDIIQKTPAFWERMVKVKLARDFGGLDRYLSDPYPSGANEYVERIEANMEKIRNPGVEGRRPARTT